MPTLNDFINMGGRLEDPRKVDQVLATLKYPLFLNASSAIKDSGEGKIVLLYKFVEKLIGQFNVREQKTSDCTSFAAAGAIDCLKAAEIVSKNERELWVAETSTEDIYCGSRIQIGKNELGSGGGSYGSWISSYINRYGTLVRQNYGKYDLSKYDVKKTTQWAKSGTPQELLIEAEKHKVRTVSLVKTYKEVINGLANGFPTIICSQAGFSNIRDKNGFLVRSGSWPHAMYIAGFDDIGSDLSRKRGSVCIINSWGRNWVSGPKRHNQPDGSFWIFDDVLEESILSSNDCWIISGYDGFPVQKLNLRII